jgi:hypothetical protein
MTSTPTKTTTPSKTSKAADALETKSGAIVRTTRDVADTVASVASDVSARLPEAAAGTGKAFDDARRLVQTGSDDTLKLVGALSVGFAVGLLVGGANRLLVIAALVPTGLIATTLAERMDDNGGRGRRGVQAA